MEIREETVTGVMRQLVDDPLARLMKWDRRTLGGGVTGEVGTTDVQRVSGTALSHGGEVGWSVIRKLLRRQTVIDAPGLEIRDVDPSGWAYWRREADVYGSGLVDDLDGLLAPRCFAIDATETEIALWLEDLPDEGPLEWQLGRYGLASRHLGQFGGRYLVGADLPRLPWLSRGRVRGWLDGGASGIRAMRAGRRDDLSSAWLSDDSVSRIEHLWTEREVLIDALESLPVTLCHHDAGRRNLAARWVDGVDRTAAIDWQMMGTGHLGEEPAAMLAVSLQLLDAPMADARAFERMVLDGYVEGLRHSGWQGDAGLVRLGFAIAASLLIGVGGAGIWFAGVSSDGGAMAERIVGRPLEEIAAQWALLQPYLLDLGDEALTSIQR